MVIYFEPNFDPTSMTPEEHEAAVNKQLGLKPRHKTGDSSASTHIEEGGSMEGIE